MDAILQVGLQNAALAVPLALIALLVGVLAKRPALVHALWLLVLLRLLLPPLWGVDLPKPGLALPGASSPPVEGTLAPGGAWSSPPERAQLNGEFESRDATDRTLRSAVAPRVPQYVFPDPTAGDARPTGIWRPIVAAVWLAGAMAFVMTALCRTWRFAALLRVSERAEPATQRLANRLGRRLGLRRIPPVVYARGHISPMLWSGVTVTLLVLPESLWLRLGPARRATLLAHELAHFRRGDHLIRWMELLAAIAFWWHPAVWLARWNLRATEEQCCDAWVVWALPGLRRQYAESIVDVLGFLTEGRSTLPALACGVGHVRQLRWRMTMIMRGTTPRALPRSAAMALIACGFAFGTVAPTWADDKPQDSPRGRPPERREGERRTEERHAPDAPAEEGDRAALERELQRARAEFERARTRIEDLERRLARSREMERPREPRADREGGRAELREVGRPPASVPGRPLEPNAGGVERRMESLERQLEAVMRQMEAMRREMQRGRGERRPGDTPPGLPPAGGPGPGMPPGPPEELPGGARR